VPADKLISRRPFHSLPEVLIYQNKAMSISK
jgi:hypothetical protein